MIYTLFLFFFVHVLENRCHLISTSQHNNGHVKNYCCCLTNSFFHISNWTRFSNFYWVFSFCYVVCRGKLMIKIQNDTWLYCQDMIWKWTACNRWWSTKWWISCFSVYQNLLFTVTICSRILVRFKPQLANYMRQQVKHEPWFTCYLYSTASLYCIIVCSREKRVCTNLLYYTSCT